MTISPAERAAQTLPNTSKTVGILGGMGPAATVQLFDLIVHATPAATDQDHLHILINNDTGIPDRTAAILNGGQDPRPRMCQGAQLLEQMGAQLIAMPCNSAHYYWQAIQKSLQVPLLNMIDETARVIKENDPQITQVGILATSGTLTVGMYQDALRKAALTPIEPTEAERAAAMDAIYAVKAGDLGTKPRTLLRDAAQALIDRGAQAVIMGCTEIPLVLTDGDLAVPLISSTHVLADAVVREAMAS